MAETSGGAPPRPVERATLMRSTAVSITRLRCTCGRTGFGEADQINGYSIVFVDRGCFLRRSHRGEEYLDLTSVYVECPGDEQRMAHPADCVGELTGVDLGPQLLGTERSDWKWLTGLTARTTDFALDLERRLLIRAARARQQIDVEDRAVSLLSSIVRLVEPGEVLSGRPATLCAQRRLVQDVRTALAVDPQVSLLSLASRNHISPHHLSRTFKKVSGVSVTAHREALRVRLALARLTEGEQSLSRLAAELGFADHSHMTRTIRRHLGVTPSALRDALASHPRVARHEWVSNC